MSTFCFYWDFLIWSRENLAAKFKKCPENLWNSTAKLFARPKSEIPTKKLAQSWVNRYLKTMFFSGETPTPLKSLEDLVALFERMVWTISNGSTKIS